MPFFKTYSAPPELSSLVRDFQILHIQWDSGEKLPPPFITCLANTEQNLYFFPRDPIRTITASRLEITAPPAIITGPKTRPIGLLYGKYYLLIKVAFHPTGTYRLLGIPMRTTVNNGLDATQFWGDEVKNILYVLRSTNSYDSMIETVSAFLQKKVTENVRAEEAIDIVTVKMLDPFNELSLEEWASMACLSLRQFERNFITRVGISPKVFIRIVRFEYSMKVKNESPGKSWAQLALECGYTDSAHLLKEFKAFAEFPPSSFFLQPTSGYSELPTG